MPGDFLSVRPGSFHPPVVRSAQLILGDVETLPNTQDDDWRELQIIWRVERCGNLIVSATNDNYVGEPWF